MGISTSKIKSLLPVGLGLYCLIQGGALLASDNLLLQLLGAGLWLWLPGCAYHAWKGRAALAPRVVAMRPMVQHTAAQHETRAA